MKKPTEKKAYNPTKIEVAKTVAIAVLITSIVSFIGGATYAGSVNDRVEAAKASETQPVKK